MDDMHPFCEDSFKKKSLKSKLSISGGFRSPRVNPTTRTELNPVAKAMADLTTRPSTGTFDTETISNLDGSTVIILLTHKLVSFVDTLFNNAKEIRFSHRFLRYRKQ